jgi:hypothetical protein
LGDLRNTLRTPLPEEPISSIGDHFNTNETGTENIAEARQKRPKLPTIKFSAMKRQLEAYQNEKLKLRIHQAMKPFRTTLSFKKKPVNLPGVDFVDEAGNAGRRKPRKKSGSKRHNPISKEKRLRARDINSAPVDEKVDAEKFLESVALDIQVNEIAGLMEGFDVRTFYRRFYY